MGVRNTNLILFMTLLLSVAFNVWLSSHETLDSADGVEFLAIPSCRYSHVEIENSTGNLIVLDKENGWQMSKPVATVADDCVVNRFLDQLIATRITEYISDAELMNLGRTRADFSLDKPIYRITLSGDGDTRTLLFGSTNPSKDSIYVAVEGSSYIAALPANVLSNVDLSMSGLRNHSVLNIDTADIATVSIKNVANSLISLTRKDDNWFVGHERAVNKRVQDLLATVTGVAISDFVWPIGASNELNQVTAPLLTSYGLDRENAIAITIKCFDGREFSMLIGNATEHEQVYALVQNGGAIVTVPIAIRNAIAQSFESYLDTRLFPLDFNSVDSFSLSYDGLNYVFSKSLDEQWGMESPIVAPANMAVIPKVIENLIALMPSDMTTTGGVVVSVATNLLAASVSKQSVLGSYSFEDLRSRHIKCVDVEHIRRIVRTSSSNAALNDIISYSKKSNRWNVENSSDDVVIDDDGVAALLSVLGGMEAVQVEKIKVSATEFVAYGLEKPLLTIAIDHDSENSVRRNIIIGGKAKGGRYMTIGLSDAVFIVSNDVVKQLMSKLTDK